MDPNFSRSFAPNLHAGISYLRTASFSGLRKNVLDVLHTAFAALEELQSLDLVVPPLHRTHLFLLFLCFFNCVLHILDCLR